MSRFENRRFVVITAEEVSSIDFTQVMETSADTLRYSLDGNYTFVKYEGERPSSIPESATEYTHPEFIELLSTDVWSSNETVE